MSADFPITYITQIEGDSEVQAKLKQIDNALDETGDSAEQSAQKTSEYSGALGELSDKTEVTKSMTAVLGETFKASALGISSVAATATNLYFQYDNLEKAETRVDKAEKTLTTSKSALISAQERVNKLHSEGVVSGATYEKAQLDLKAAQDGVSIATDRLNQSQGDLTESQMNFALGVVPTVFSALSTVQSVTSALRLAKIADVGVTGAQAVANLGAAGTATVLTGATVTQTAATEGATMATRLFQLALGPVGLVIIGIGGAMAAFATNAFGVRDAINGVGKAIGDAFPQLRWLLDGLSNLAQMIFPEARDETKSFENTFSASMAVAGADASSFSSNVSLSAADVAMSFASLNQSAQADLDAIAGRAGSTASSVEKAAERMKKALGSKGNPIAVDATTSAADFRTMPNPLGGTTSTYDPFFGAARISESSAALANYTPARVNEDAYRRAVNPQADNSIVGKIGLELTIDAEGQAILRKAVKNSQGGFSLGINHIS
jgi:hypothetical protein